MDRQDVTEFSKILAYLSTNSKEKARFREFELSVEAFKDTTSPFGVIGRILRSDESVVIAYNFSDSLTSKHSSVSADEILNSTEIANEDRKCDETGASVLEGSPLKLVTIADLSSIPNSTTVKTADQRGPRQRRCEPVSVKRARYLLSLFEAVQQTSLAKGTEDSKPLWVLCDGEKPERIVCMSVGYTLPTGSNANSENLHANISTVVTMSGPTSKSSFTASSLECTHMTKTMSCLAEYDVIGSLSKENPMAGLQGSVKLEMRWTSAQHLLQTPPIDAETIAKVQLVPGDSRSTAYALYSELDMLRRLIESQKSGEIRWAAREGTVGLLDEVTLLLRNLAYGDAAPRSDSTADTTEMKNAAESMELEDRSGKDFTDYLWIVLKGSTSLSELIEGFQFVFNQLKSGKLQPMVHRNNKTSVAQLVRDSYTGRVTVPVLSKGMLAIELLAEIGAEKLIRDYINVFLSKDLTTMKHLEYFLERSVSLPEKLERLEKLHCVLELVIILRTFLHTPHATLSVCARQTLQYLQTATLDWKHVFEVSISTPSVAKLLESSQPCTWECHETQLKESSGETVVQYLSIDPPFQHVDFDSCLAVDQRNVDITLNNDLEYFLVTIKENVVLV